MSGDHRVRPQLLAALARGAARPGRHRKQGAERSDRRRPYGPCAQPCARRPGGRAADDARLLLAPTRLSAAAGAGAAVAPADGDRWRSDFLAPLVTAWEAADRGDIEALATLDEIPANSLLAPLADEERALILLKFRRTAEAEPFARRAIGAAGGARAAASAGFADGFLAAGDQRPGADDLEGMGAGEAAARPDPGRQVERPGIDTGAEALQRSADRFRGRPRRGARRRRSGWSRSRAMPTRRTAARRAAGAAARWRRTGRRGAGAARRDAGKRCPDRRRSATFRRAS